MERDFTQIGTLIAMPNQQFQHTNAERISEVREQTYKTPKPD